MEPNVDTTQLAVDRTWLSHERTLMAWVRTAASQISFGFTIYKFFQLDENQLNRVGHPWLSARTFALVLVSVGMLSLLVATIQHRRQIEMLKPYVSKAHRSLAEVVAAITSLFGIFVLLSAAFHK